jgi:type II secretory pathway component GspD/PulD (secretin)
MALAAFTGVWASVAVGQGKGPSLDELLIPDPPAPAAKPTAAKPAAPAPVAAKPVEKPAAPAPVAAKPVEKPAAPAPVAAKPVEKPAVKTPDPVAAKPVEKAPEPVAATHNATGKYKIAKEEKPAAVAQEPEKKKVDKPVAAAAQDDDNTDEINLDDVDDSAVAAKGRPVVKLAPQAQAAPAAQESSPESKAAPATGSEIAARFLASDETALVDIMSDDATLTDILRQFRRATGANIIYAESSNLHQRVSVSLKHVPWLHGMTSILNSRGFRVESSGGIHFVKEDKLLEPIFTRTFQLNHASVDELAKLFNDSYGLKGKDGKLVKGVATSFQGANTIVVTANERTLADCEAIIKAVDKAVPQIYIEARFIELSNEAMHKLGLQWDQLKSWGATVHNLNGGMEYNNGRVANYGRFISKQTEDSTYSGSGSTGSSSVEYKGFIPDGITTPNRLSDNVAGTADMAWRNARVFSGQLSVDDFNLAMSAFEQLQDTKIFSNPKVIVSNGKKANVDMTTKFPNIELTSQRNTSASASYLDMSAELKEIPGKDKELFAGSCFYSWGITLDVTPRISPDGLISVEIIPTISELDTDVTQNGFYAVQGADSSVGMFPIIRLKRITTDFTMKDGATAVIGGLSRTTEDDIDSGIPYLRKIPWVGPKLFGWKSRGKVQKEILVFVTVGIADPANLPEDVGLPKNAVRGREYVEKRVLEPGDRPDAAKNALTLDTRSMDEHINDIPPRPAPADARRGTVTITPVVQ